MPHHPHDQQPPHGGLHHQPHHGDPHHPSPHHNRGYWAPFPTQECQQLLQEMFRSEDLAQAAIRILYDCPPEIALVVEAIARTWRDKSREEPAEDDG